MRVSLIPLPRTRNVIGMRLAVRVDELGDQPGPPGLVRGADAPAVVAVEAASLAVWALEPGVAWLDAARRESRARDREDGHDRGDG